MNHKLYEYDSFFCQLNHVLSVTIIACLLCKGKGTIVSIGVFCSIFEN